MTHRQSPFLRLDPVGGKRDLDDAGLLATTRSPRATAVQGCRRSPAHGSPPERAQTAASLPCWQRTHPLSPSSSQPTFIRPYRHLWVRAGCVGVVQVGSLGWGWEDEMGMDSSAVLALPSEDRVFEVRVALAGFLADYSGNTRLAYHQDLRQFASWCHNQDLGLLAVRRIDVELFARWLEHRGAARATIGRRLSTVTGFYRYCVEEELLTRNPAANVRRPRLRRESTMSGLDRNELGAFLVQAGLSETRDHALACLLALNGLHVLRGAQR